MWWALAAIAVLVLVLALVVRRQRTEREYHLFLEREAARVEADARRRDGYPPPEATDPFNTGPSDT
jgi:hypothetical protein